MLAPIYLFICFKTILLFIYVYVHFCVCVTYVWILWQLHEDTDSLKLNLQVIMMLLCWTLRSELRFSARPISLFNCLTLLWCTAYLFFKNVLFDSFMHVCAVVMHDPIFPYLSFTPFSPLPSFLTKCISHFQMFCFVSTLCCDLLV